MNRLLYTLTVGLVGAALIHVILMLVFPSIAAKQAWGRLAAALPMETPRRLEGAGLPVAPGDPLFRTLLCGFDLRDGPLHVSASGRSAFWSAVVFTPDGRAVASVNSGMTGDGEPNLQVLPHSQMNNTDSDGSFPLVADEGEALFALRVFVPDESWAPLADALLNSVTCTTEPREGRH